MSRERPVLCDRGALGPWVRWIGHGLVRCLVGASTVYVPHAVVAGAVESNRRAEADIHAALERGLSEIYLYLRA